MAGGGTDAKTKTSNKMGSFSMSSKPRVGVILRQAAGGQKPTHTPSEKVESLQNKYKDMCQNLKRLLKVLKERHAAMLETMQARDAMALTFASLSKDTPLSELLGTPSSSKSTTTTGGAAGEYDPNKITYANAVDTWTTKSRSRADDFTKNVIDYVASWEKILTTRVNAEMKATEQLRRDADHYKTKVDALTASMEKLERQKNKPVPASTKEKWHRNTEKSEEATVKYQESADQLYILLDEVVNRAWRDLLPLLVQVLQRDDLSSSDDEAVLKEMRSVGSSLVDLARAEEIKPRYKPTWTWSHVGASFFEEDPPSF